MRTRTELRPGRTYILDDFTVVQILDAAGGTVVYRIRSRSWLQPRRFAIRRRGLARLAGRVRAEVNGEFFPDVALPGLHQFERPSGEAVALNTYLAEGAVRWPRWPFAGEA